MSIVVVHGDSISWGSGVEDGYVWHQRLAQRSASTWFAPAIGGFRAYNPPVTAAKILAYPGSGERIVLLAQGTGDLYDGQSAAQLKTNISTIATDLRNGGAKVIVATVQDIFENIAGQEVQRGIYNTDLRLTYTGFADALADIAAGTGMSDHTNSTYYLTDGIHLKRAAHIVWATIWDAAIATL